MKLKRKISEKISKPRLAATLYALPQLIKIVMRADDKLRKKVAERDFVAQISIRDCDCNVARTYEFKGGKVKTRSGTSVNPQVSILFNTAEEACRLLAPNASRLETINAMKNFRMSQEGVEEDAVHFMEILSLMMHTRDKYGTPQKDGSVRMTNCTNGGAVFVDVKDDKIVRIYPMDFDDKDPDSWTIEARGKKFSPPKRSTIAPHTQAVKSTIYSKDRNLYPMKRVDFDVDGERNIQNRGKSEYVRISWDEALDIAEKEIKRMKSQYGPGAIATNDGSHHTWGNLGYYLSAKRRAYNTVGVTYIDPNPDSWEGWYWGAMHHWGNSINLGAPETYNTCEDLLQNCEQIVFWSSDPESTSGIYAGMEGTIRRLWAKEDLGIEMVHIDPFYNHTAALMGGKWFAPRPDTGGAMALGIAYVWITEGLYDKEFVATKTDGFEEWRDYVLGKMDGVAKTPEWTEAETNIPARDLRALARRWGTKKTYLAAGGLQGFGSACRNATGINWARTIVCLMAMQGIGKPGVNMGNMQQGAPLDTRFYFPGYADGCMSGDLAKTGLSVHMYQRAPQLPTMNTVFQRIPRLKLAECITEGKCETYPWDSISMEAQFFPQFYPAPGHSPVHMYWKYGASHFGTVAGNNKLVDMYHHDSLEFVMSQSIWFEGEAKYADLILPACTNFERWDIGELSHCSGYIQHSFTMNNARLITMQHKCIEPLGESKSDFTIFKMVLSRLDLGLYFTEGSDELDWCKRIYDGSDVKDRMAWKDFLERGYYVVPPPAPENRDPVAWRWYYDGVKKDTPMVNPLPSAYKGKHMEGLQTQSGKIEFVANSLKRFDADDPERPPLPTYIPSFEGHHVKDLYKKYPLNLITPHPRYSFHTFVDGKGSWLNDIPAHRVEIDGEYWWPVRINPADAAARNIKHHQLVEVHNDRASVICAALVTERVPVGTMHSYESSARYEPIGELGKSPDKGGCMNLLAVRRTMIKRSHATCCNTALVEIRPWDPTAPMWKPAAETAKAAKAK